MDVEINGPMAEEYQNRFRNNKVSLKYDSKLVTFFKSSFHFCRHDCSPHNRDIIQEIRKTDLSKEVEWLKSVIESSNYPVLFCHNDLQEGNILVKGLPESDERLVPRDTLR